MRVTRYDTTGHLPCGSARVSATLRLTASRQSKVPVAETTGYMKIINIFCHCLTSEVANEI